MIIRATQKKRMSQPVSSMLVGKNFLKSSLSVLGQPRMAMGHRPELNQVSRQSGSCSKRYFLPAYFSAALALASSGVLPTTQGESSVSRVPSSSSRMTR
jgi:hypothetical protein